MSARRVVLLSHNTSALICCIFPVKRHRWPPLLLVAGVPLFSFIMAAAQSTRVTFAQGHRASFSSDSALPGRSPPVRDEASPLLPEHSQEPPPNTSARWLPAQLSASAFLDNNAGLLLVVASQFFFSAIGISVKWLNSLDEPVPTFEVRPRPIVSEIGLIVTLRS